MNINDSEICLLTQFFPSPFFYQIFNVLYFIFLSKFFCLLHLLSLLLPLFWNCFCLYTFFLCHFYFFFISYLDKIIWFWRWMVLLLFVEIIVPCNLMSHLRMCFGKLAWESQILHLKLTESNLLVAVPWCYKLHFLSHHHKAKSVLYIFVVPLNLDHSLVPKACFASNIFHSVSSKNKIQVHPKYFILTTFCPVECTK